MSTVRGTDIRESHATCWVMTNEDLYLSSRSTHHSARLYQNCTDSFSGIYSLARDINLKLKR